MTYEIVLVLLITIAAMTLFVTEKLRIDAIAILVLVSSTLLDLVSPSQALSGFSNPPNISVATWFILAAGLQNRGARAGMQRLLGTARSPVHIVHRQSGLLALIAPVDNTARVV